MLPWVFQQPPGHITSALSGPQPYVFKQPGARQTIKIGCLLEMPQEGQRPEDAFSSANFEAMKLALQDKLPPLKLPINVNLTCLYLNVRPWPSCDKTCVTLRGEWMHAC